MSNSAENFEGFAIVEMMGRNVIAGYCSSQVVAGVAMLRVDVPAMGDKPGFTKFVARQAIYGLTPTDEETAKTAAENLRTRPIDLWIVPERKALPVRRNDDVNPDLEYARQRDYEDDGDEDEDEPNF